MSKTVPVEVYLIGLVAALMAPILTATLTALRERRRGALDERLKRLELEQGQLDADRAQLRGVFDAGLEVAAAARRAVGEYEETGREPALREAAAAMALYLARLSLWMPGTNAPAETAWSLWEALDAAQSTVDEWRERGTAATADELEQLSGSLSTAYEAHAEAARDELAARQSVSPSTDGTSVGMPVELTASLVAASVFVAATVVVLLII